MQIQPYIFMDGRCEEAVEFYKKTLGAEVEMMMRFDQSPEPHASGMLPPGAEKKIMHCAFRVGGSTVLASDGRCGGHPKFEGMALSLTVATQPDAVRIFDALAAGGQVQMPMAKTFFSPKFGMVADQFGVSWMVYVAKS